MEINCIMFSWKIEREAKFQGVSTNRIKQNLGKKLFHLHLLDISSFKANSVLFPSLAIYHLSAIARGGAGGGGAIIMERKK